MIRLITVVPKMIPKRMILTLQSHIVALGVRFRTLLYSIPILVLPGIANAQGSHILNAKVGGQEVGSTLTNETGLGKNDPVALTSSIIEAILGVLAIIAVVLIIYAGFIWLFSRGNEEEIKKAQGILKASFIALLIILAAYGIAIYIISIIEQSTG